MCPSNTSTLLCGVPTTVYLNAPPGLRNKVHFDSYHHGLILWTLASAKPPLDAKMAGLAAQGRPMPPELDDVLQSLWKACHMDGQNREGLATFQATFLKLVMNIAKASCAFGASTVSVDVMKSWEIEPTIAFAWIQEQLSQRRKMRFDYTSATEVGKEDHGFSDYATMIDDLWPQQISSLRLELDRSQRTGQALSPSAHRWVNRNKALVHYNDLLGQQDPLIDRYEDPATSKKDKGLLAEQLKELDVEIDRLKQLYHDNGGRQQKDEDDMF